ncbi:hypothetical protein MUP77_08495 [Candidatus Bathyarchaeota archaeon]|nr:hypothetical protein [Candidatus Bathyarchaeota archaeon]
MTPYEVASLVIAVVAIVISVVSVIRTHKVQAKQLEFEAITAALAKKQLELLGKKEQRREQAHVTAELVKVGRSDYRFVIMNQGVAIASDVTFEIDPMSPDNPLVTNECARKLPYPSLQPGQSFTLIAALSMDSAMSYNTQLKWKNPDGSQGTNNVHLSV